MRQCPRAARIASMVPWAATTAGACLTTALVATWPLPLHLATAVPLGTEHEVTVPLFDLWALWWTADRARHGFIGYGDAPIFFPNNGVTHYSEPLPLLGLLVAPLWGLGAPPALIYNVALLAVLTLNGLFGYRLARATGAPPLPALLGGLLMVTLPFVGKVQGVLPNMALFGLLWTLDGVIRFGQTGGARWAFWGAAGFAATYHTMQQYALFFAPFAGAAAVIALKQRQQRAGAAARLVAAGLAAGLAILPAALPAIGVP